MNKKHAGTRVCLLVTFFAAIAFTGCRSGSNKASQEELKVNIPENTGIYDDIKQAEKIFNALPSPIESAMLLKAAGAEFDASLLNPVDNAGRYVSNKSMALNLGIYTCDLSVASLYEQTQLIINYMNSAKKMADGLGILDAIDQSTINRLEENINNNEVIMEIVSETFLNSNSYLEDNGQPAIAAMTLVGGWLEGLYISTRLVDMNNFNGDKIASRIIDQKLSLDILINLLGSNQGDPAIDELIAQVNKLKAVFDKVTITASPVSTELDNASNSTILKSEAKTDMTPEVFKELASTVNEIRNSFIK
ncbi:MAG: hypothetical protein LBV26_05340 [Bacteroidales bacterium]|jgi:archaellum component FlaC|nr:hypothetical protein [Bacteroidales bacterium]